MSQPEEFYYFNRDVNGKWCFVPSSSYTLSKTIDVNGRIYTFSKSYYSKLEKESIEKQIAEREIKNDSPELWGPFLYCVHNRNYTQVVNIWKPYPSQLLLFSVNNR